MFWHEIWIGMQMWKSNLLMTNNLLLLWNTTVISYPGDIIRQGINNTIHDNKTSASVLI